MRNNPSSYVRHLISATKDWILENKGKPCLTISIAHLKYYGGLLPIVKLNDELITLSISNDACINYKIDNTSVKFECSFNHESFKCIIPLNSIVGITDLDSKLGMMFNIPDNEDTVNDESKAIADDIISNLINNIK